MKNREKPIEMAQQKNWERQFDVLGHCGVKNLDLVPLERSRWIVDGLASTCQCFFSFQFETLFSLICYLFLVCLPHMRVRTRTLIHHMSLQPTMLSVQCICGSQSLGCIFISVAPAKSNIVVTIFQRLLAAHSVFPCHHYLFSSHLACYCQACTMSLKRCMTLSNHRFIYWFCFYLSLSFSLNFSIYRDLFVWQLFFRHRCFRRRCRRKVFHARIQFLSPVSELASIVAVMFIWSDLN